MARITKAERDSYGKEMIEKMAAKGYWRSPSGRTPASTLDAAILKELTTKGK